FAGSLVAREQFLPDVERHEQTWRACWKPILAGDDARHANELARVLPAACRALALDCDSPPARSAVALLSDFLALAVDALVRSAMPSATALAVKQPKRPAPSFDSLHDQWLHALRDPEGTLHGTAKELTEL